MRTTSSEVEHPAGLSLPVFLPLLLLLALPLRAASALLPAKLDGSAAGLNRNAEEYGWRRMALKAARPLTVLIGLGVFFSQAQPANDMFSNRIVIVGTNTVVTGSNAGATNESGEPNHAGNSGGASVWWSWTAPLSDTVTIKTAGSTLDTLLAIYTGSPVSALAPVASNDDDPVAGDFTSKVTQAFGGNE